LSYSRQSTSQLFIVQVANKCNIVFIFILNNLRIVLLIISLNLNLIVCCVVSRFIFFYSYELVIVNNFVCLLIIHIQVLHHPHQSWVGIHYQNEWTWSIKCQYPIWRRPYLWQSIFVLLPMLGLYVEKNICDNCALDIWRNVKRSCTLTLLWRARWLWRTGQDDGAKTSSN
jgi:hypothetical protein